MKSWAGPHQYYIPDSPHDNLFILQDQWYLHCRSIVKNHRSGACTVNSKREEVCLHPVPSVEYQFLLIFFKEILGLLLFFFLTVYDCFVVVGVRAFSNLLIIVKI